LVILFSLANLDCLCFVADAAGEPARRLAGYEILLVVIQKGRLELALTMATGSLSERWLDVAFR
jgi:hypothetical protein